MRGLGFLFAALSLADPSGPGTAESAEKKPEAGAAAPAPKSIPPKAPAAAPAPEAALVEVFTRADANADGKITEEEWRKGRPAVLFGQMDANRDRVLDVLEVRAAIQKLIDSMKQRLGQLFAQLDTNKDGALSPDEFSAYAMRQELPTWARVQPRLERVLPAESPSAPRQPVSGNTARDFLKKLDKDGDGKISLDEFLGPEDVFRRIDKDGDGSIDEDEIRALRDGAGGAKQP